MPKNPKWKGPSECLYTLYWFIFIQTYFACVFLMKCACKIVYLHARNTTFLWPVRYLYFLQFPSNKIRQKTWLFYLSFVTLLKKIHHPLLFRLHLQSSNHQDVQNVSVSTFDINMIYIKWRMIFAVAYIVNWTQFIQLLKMGQGYFAERRTSAERRMTWNEIKFIDEG